ncbi:hypothetical protein AB4039_21785 [Streptomyces sp. M-16]|uniref:hypothetical protein n=1 Tax=Streptomyces sp. M-16 TaxID=3233040 RepID=UPI003F94504D
MDEFASLTGSLLDGAGKTAGQTLMLLLRFDHLGQALKPIVSVTGEPDAVLGTKAASDGEIRQDWFANASAVHTVRAGDVKVASETDDLAVVACGQPSQARQ